ncbi:DUF6476 family protein [Pseudogemmobacter sonorensis]|uniref:DUF6476 family protein n=1 Tax=Pseudogemmobacter sonorensis TaxID=2989681 RepID=UPI0036874993
MTPGSDMGGLPPSLRLLKALVIVLMLSMIGGVIAVVALLVTRLPPSRHAPPPALPDGIRLPEGETAGAVTFGTGWILVVTESDRILIFDTDGRLRQDTTLSP